jgi:hypothetical protein
MVTVTAAAAAAVTAGVLTDELIWRRGDHVTESCLAAIEIDRSGQTPGRRLRVAGKQQQSAGPAAH